jgi:hypothetical protein
MHQHPLGKPSLFSASSAKAGHVDSSSAAIDRIPRVWPLLVVNARPPS